MSAAHWLRLGFVLATCAFFGVRFFYLRRVGQEPATMSEHPVLAVFMTAMKPVFFASVVLWLVRPSWIAFADLPVPMWLQWVGLGLIGLTTGLYAWVHHALGDNFHPLLRLRDAHQLVTTGPYRFARHPMYTVLFFTGIGILLCTANVLVGGLNALGMMAASVVRLPREERMLIERFGDGYRAYQQRVGRYTPWW